MKPHIQRKNGVWVVLAIGTFNMDSCPRCRAAVEFVRRQVTLGLW